MNITFADLETLLPTLTASATPYEFNITDTVASNWTGSSTPPANTIQKALRSVISGVYIDLSATEIPSSVTDMMYTFYDCSSLTTAPTIPSSVTNMMYTFRGCSSLTTAPTIPSSVTNMRNTFGYCSSLTTAPTIPSSVTDMYGTFRNCSSLTTIDNWQVDTSQCTMSDCFYACTSLANIYTKIETPEPDNVWSLWRFQISSTTTKVSVTPYNGTTTTTLLNNTSDMLLKLYNYTDELLFDSYEAITDNIMNSVLLYKLPFGDGLDPTKQYMVVWAKDPENVVSNCFLKKSDVFNADGDIAAATATLADRAKDSYPIPTDAVLQYSFDEIGAMIIDNSYGESHAENHGVIPVEGVCGKAGYFNNSYMIAPRPALGDDITIYFWAKFDALGIQTIVQSRTGIGEGLSVFQIDSLYRFDWRGTQTFFTGYTPLVDTWHHVCMKMNATTAVLKINGELKSTLTGTYGTTENLASTIWSGMSGTGGELLDNPLTGAIDGLKIVPRFTTDDEDIGEYKARANLPKFYAYDTYSTAEHRIGTWIDGKPLYRKVVNFGTLPNASSKIVAHGISNIAFVTTLKGISYNNSSKSYNPLPYGHSSGLYSISLAIVGATIQIVTGIDRTDYTDTKIIIEYTKTTD